MKNYLHNSNVVFIDFNKATNEYIYNLIKYFPSPTIYTWSYKYPTSLKSFAKNHDINLLHVEDGFIRSVGFGSDKSKPLSLTYDRTAMHFDRNITSDLEKILSIYDFSSDITLMNTAIKLLDIIQTNEITKYNFIKSGISLETIVNRDVKHRILVLGQVDNDLSIKYGSPDILSGNDLVAIAAAENPGAQILYRPHPELALRQTKCYPNPRDVADICYILPQQATLYDCFKVATKAYTVTSLSGFEALLFGLPVKVFGNPFYSGWGVTEDVYPLHRRSRKLSVLEIFAGAYILYSKYYHPITNLEISPIEAVNLLIAQKHRHQTQY